MFLDRRSDKHGQRVDAALEAEVAAEIRSGQRIRAEDWREPEPVGDDQHAPYPRGGPAPGIGEDLDAGEVEMRSELARHLDRNAFPADRAALDRALTARYAPEPLVGAVRDRLPGGRWFHNVDEAVHAMRG
ncbi:DUF2795 domain-containing protein [Yinghuangia sp. ASG 101]|uniref:DUF2795 domain-containing protein n=1 Tax=Yinghuangia sp. ASG 101 TaxID=2896848 RepID=UPI001E347299|nr:DUF2795 domain-containing protein [Yinghuangia sp. ASG 101]UGQ12713.1 DUF2795 domain-containing protein [Yinghuangia sp. ASG 101]